MSDDPLTHFSATAEPLLDLLSQQIDESMLREIAQADYGEDFEEHLKALIAAKNGHILAPMQWCPREVLELTRWTEPDDLSKSAVAERVRGHWMRLFSCSILLHADVNPNNGEAYHWPTDETAIQLVESALVLGLDVSRAVLPFLCWCCQAENTQEDEVSWYLVLAVLRLAMSLERCDLAMQAALMERANPEGREFGALIKTSLRAEKWQQLMAEIVTL